MDRRSFLRGTLLTGSAVALGPGVVDLLGGEAAAAESSVAVVRPFEGVAPRDPHIITKMKARVAAHHALFGEAPKALFVNRYEMRELQLAITPLRRYTSTKVADVGFQNLMVAGIPTLTVENDVIEFNPE